MHEWAGIRPRRGYHFNEKIEAFIGKVEGFHIYSYKSEARKFARSIRQDKS